MIEQKFQTSYIDYLDRKIFNFVEYEGYEDKYPSLTAQEFSADFYEEIRYASKELFNIFCKTATVFQNTPNKFMEMMDMPEKVIPFLNISNPLNLPTWLSRFDFVIDNHENIHAVELNADTPCSFVESIYGQEIATSMFQMPNPNTNSRQDFMDFFKEIHSACKPLEVDLYRRNFINKPFIFSCFDDYPEDYGTTKFLMSLMKSALPYEDIRFVSFYDLKIDNDGIILEDGQHASAIYRLHPLELLIDEKTEDNEDLGRMFLQLYDDGMFKMFNPPEALILQNKSFMSLVYRLYLNNEFFSPHERSIIEQYLTPSYFEDDFDNLDTGTYICKNIWGREGKGVHLVKKENKIKRTIYEKEYNEEIICRESNKVMYQDFIEQKVYQHEVTSGLCEGYLTISCSMLGKKPSAIYTRFSPDKIAATEAYWVPNVIIQGVNRKVFVFD